MPIANRFSLEGKNILIAGAAGGIGAATARVCASLGADLLLTDIRDVSDLRNELQETGCTVATAKIDLTDRRSIEALVAEAGPIDAAVDCSGIFPQDDWLTDPDWDATFWKVLEVNVAGPLNLARAVLPGMIQRKSGRIVLLGSVAGRNGGTAKNVQPHYAIAKGGVHSLVRWLSRRAAPHGVIVNGIAPGPVDTPMNVNTVYDYSVFPMARLGRPDEIAWPIAFLCSAACSYLSGAILDVNGGNLVA